MEQEQTVDRQYLKGFNNGYLLAKHEPELAAKLTAYSNGHSKYFNGLVSGKVEYEKEVREQSKSFSKKTPVKGDRDMERER